MVEIDAFGVRRPLRVGDYAGGVELCYLSGFAAVRRDGEEVVGFEQSAVGDKKNALAVGREDGISVFEGAVRDLFGFTPFGRQQIEVVPAGVLQDGYEFLSVGRPLRSADGPSTAAIHWRGVERNRLSGALAGLRIKVDEVEAAAEVLLGACDIDDRV